jgi:peptide-methionine (S)-S-oxide reductase
MFAPIKVATLSTRLVAGLAGLIALVVTACASESPKPPRHTTTNPENRTMNANTEVATLGGGCFWCIEAVFDLLEGVQKVESGYTGGAVENPTYKAVCTGNTGHAEVVQVTFDPSVVSFSDVLQVFFASHDPTTLNRQGNDVGTQYRSAIFYSTAEQKTVAEDYIRQLEASKTWSKPIVTEVTALTTFYKAEDYHQDYYAQNGSQPYCAFVVRPKVEKFMKEFGDRAKKKN